MKQAGSEGTGTVEGSQGGGSGSSDGDQTGSGSVISAPAAVRLWASTIGLFGAMVLFL